MEIKQLRGDKAYFAPAALDIDSSWRRDKNVFNFKASSVRIHTNQKIPENINFIAINRNQSKRP